MFIFMKKEKFDKAYNYAIKLLKIKDKSENEIKEKLLNLKFDNHTVEKVIEKLKTYNLIDDRRFAQNYLAKQIKKCKNIKLIIEELKNKFKLENEIINNINLENFKKQLLENTVVAIKNKYPELNLLKIQNFLLSKGFDYTEIEEIINLLKEKKDDNYR